MYQDAMMSSVWNTKTQQLNTDGEYDICCESAPWWKVQFTQNALVSGDRITVQ